MRFLSCVIFTASILLGSITQSFGQTEASSIAPYTFTSIDNTTYIHINQDLDAFKLNTDFHSIGNSGLVGYYIIPNGLSGAALDTYLSSINMSDPQFGKHMTDGVIEISDLKAGEKIGLYFTKKNGRIYQNWKYGTDHKNSYIRFNKNGNHGRDELIYISGIDVQLKANDIPTGAPITKGATYLCVAFSMIILICQCVKTVAS